MSLFEQHTPEDNDAEHLAWRQSFEEASEMPPARVWDAIERRLDREERGIVPLWGATPTSGASSMVGGLVQRETKIIRPWIRWSAAAVAALVVISLGWWGLQADELAINTSPVADRSAYTKSAPVSANQSLQPASKAEETVLGSNLSTVNVDKFVSPMQTVEKTGSLLKKAGEQERTNADRASVSMALKAAVASKSQEKGELVTNQTDEQRNVTADMYPVKGNHTAVLLGRFKNPVTMVGSGQAGASREMEWGRSRMDLNKTSIVGLVDIKPLDAPQINANLHETQRIVWFRAPEAEFIDTQSSNLGKQRERWASASVMPSSFNPVVSLQAASAEVVYASYVPTSNQYTSNSELVNSQANLSVTYQLATGMQLGRRWSIETGVGYLDARSTVNSPVQTIVPSMVASAVPVTRASNLYVDVLRGNSGNVSAALNDKISQSSVNSNLYNTAQTQVVRNDYQFVQVPVQVGYQLRPRKRLGMALLGGLLSNWFIRNKVADELTIGNRDGIYRPLTLSATTGLRLRYRPTQRWSASLAGVYQHALQNGALSAVGVQVHPKAAGISMGVDYHF